MRAARESSDRRAPRGVDAEGASGLLPLPGSELLLDAALARGAQIPGALDRWLAATSPGDPATLPSPDRRLLPAIAGRLREAGASHPYTESARPVIERMEERTRRHLAVAREALDLLDRAGIPALALKGVALAAERYPDPAQRYMTDVDILVRPGDVSPALDALARAGLALTGVPPALRPFLCAVDLVRPAADARVDLHQYLIEYGAPPAAEQGLWARARPCPALGPAARTPSDTDTLLHICCAALKFGRFRNTRWVVDAARLLEAARVDGPLLVEEARRRGMTLPLRICLAYLERRFGIDVPGVLPALELEPVRERHRRTLRALTRRPRSLEEALDQQRALYEFGTRAGALPRGPVGFVAFACRHLAYRWGVTGRGATLREALRRAARLAW